MQWNTARTGNPWPQDMLISVDDHPLALDQLLFERHVWSIAENIDLPPLSPEPNRGASKLPVSVSIDEWSDRGTLPEAGHGTGTRFKIRTGRSTLLRSS